jgi:VWFA-related protein
MRIHYDFFTMKTWPICVLCSLLVLGLQPQTSFAQASGPKIILDVVVTNAGKPAPGLTQQDFVITDNKKPVTGVALEANSPTNIILVLDTQNAQVKDIPNEVRDLKKFFSQNNGQLTHPVSLAIITVGGIEMTEQPMTDGSKLIAFLDQKKTTQVHSVPDTAGFNGDIQKLNNSLKTLVDLINTNVGRGPGRKMLIWMGHSWPVIIAGDMSAKDEDNAFLEIAQTSTSLRRDRITLYSADSTVSSNEGYDDSLWKGFLKPAASAKGVELGSLALEVLATQSGGQVINSVSDLSEELNRCFADADAFYTVTFDAAPAAHANEYHPIAIKMGKPGLSARTQQGYYSHP